MHYHIVIVTYLLTSKTKCRKTSSITEMHNAMVTCEIKLFQKYFSLYRRLSEIILFQHVETCLKLFQRLIAAHEYFPTCSMSLK